MENRVHRLQNFFLFSISVWDQTDCQTLASSSCRIMINILRTDETETCKKPSAVMCALNEHCTNVKMRWQDAEYYWNSKNRLEVCVYLAVYIILSLFTLTETMSVCLSVYVCVSKGRKQKRCEQNWSWQKRRSAHNKFSSDELFKYKKKIWKLTN